MKNLNTIPSQVGTAAPVGATSHGFSAPAWAPERWRGIVRAYDHETVKKLSGSLRIEHTLAQVGARKLWQLLHTEPYVNTLGAFTGLQAVQHVRAGLKAIYLSGWQVAADANVSGQTYPDQSLYPVNSVPEIVRKINRAFQRQDQIQSLDRAQGDDHDDYDWYVPIVADAEAGFGGPLNAFELMKAMIEAGASGVHFEDQLSSEKKCGHLGGKVLIPTQSAIRQLCAARLAADVMGVPTVLLARTDAESARLITSDVDAADHPFISGERTAEGFFRISGGIDMGIARGLAYAPYADLLWMETSTPSIADAQRFAEAIHAKFPGKLLAYNCSPSFNWAKHLDQKSLEHFQQDLGALGYKFQFITLAGFHSSNLAAFSLAKGYKARGMAKYSELQQQEFAATQEGFTAVRHQHEVGVGYYDAVSQAVTRGESSTAALADSTETAQFS